MSSQPDRLPEYSLHEGINGIRLPLRATTATNPPSSSQIHITAPDSVASQATAIFKVHLKETHPDGPEIIKLIEFLHSLDTDLSLELNAVYECASSSTILILKAPWRVWAELKGLRNFSLVADTVGSNKLSGLLSRMPHSVLT